MANTEFKMDTIKNGLDTLKGKVRELNQSTINFSEEMVENGLKTGTEWQKIFAKAVKHGIVLADKQQKLVLDTLEAVKGQVSKSAKQYQEVLGFDSKMIEDQIEKGKKLAKKAQKMAYAKTDEVIASVSAATDQMTKEVTKEVNATKAQVKKQVTKAAKQVEEVVEDVVEDIQEAFNTNLTDIKGIGPKLEQHLNKAGIESIEDLAKTSEKELKTILENAGGIYKSMNPKPWLAQAKKAAKKATK